MQTILRYHCTCGALAWSPPPQGSASAPAAEQHSRMLAASGCRTACRNIAVQMCQVGVVTSNPTDGKKSSCTTVRRCARTSRLGPQVVGGKFHRVCVRTLYCFRMRCIVMSAVNCRAATSVRASTRTPVVHKSSLCSICAIHAPIRR